MSNTLDVALRMRLERDGFREGQRDVAELRREADRLGAARGGRELGQDIALASRAAEGATRDLENTRRALDRLGHARIGEHLPQQAERLAREVRSIDTATGMAVAGVRELNATNLRHFRTEVGNTSDSLVTLNRRLKEAGQTRRGLDDAGGAASFLATSAKGAIGALGAFASVDQIVAGLSRLERGFRDVDRAAAKTATTAESYDPAFRRAVIDENKRLGRSYGATQDGISGARNVFTEGGMLPEQQSLALPSTLQTAFGAQASPETIARAGRAAMETMGIDPKDIPAFYDIMAKGGKLGAFEVEAQARNFPQLGAQMKGLGVTGLGGAADLGAMLQIVRRNTGTEDEAANNLTNFLASITSPETISNFEERRSNLPRIIRDAQQNGQNPALAVVDEARRLTGGDPIKLGQLFGDQQAMNGVRALIQNRDDVETMRGALMRESTGTNERDYQYMLNTPSGQSLKREAEREAAGIELGEALNPAVAMLERGATETMRRGAHITQGFNENGVLEGARRWLSYTPLGYLWGATNNNEPPSAENIEARKAEAAQLADEIARERAGIAEGGRSQNWMADSRIANRQRRYDEIMGSLRGDLGGAESARASGQTTAELETRIQSLTQAIRDLEKRLGDAGSGAVNPISFGGAAIGEPRLWNASLGGSRVGGGGFRSAYAGGAPVMDGMANLPPGAGAAMGAGSPRGRISVTRNPGGAAGEVHDVLSADFNDAQSMALLGHMQQESGFDPASWNAKEGAGGLLQWRGNRLANLKRFAADRGMNWQDRKVQAAFVGHEMRTDPYERQRSARFRASSTVEDASAALKDYVRFGDDSAGTRLANARRFSGEFGAQASLLPNAFGGASGEVRRGSANHMRGQYGPPGSNLVTIQSPGGAKFQVHESAAASFQGFVNELEGGGYAIDPKTSGGYNHRNKRGGGGLSQHAYGNAIDINWNRNPMARKLVTDMPANVSDLAAKHGLSWGGDWKSTKDAMHFEWTGVRPDDAAIAARSGELPAGRVPRPTPRPSGAGLAEPMPTTAANGRGRAGQTVQITQHIRGGFDARVAAERSRREQHRAIRLADSGALHDTMVQPA